ncbi:MAG TPA: glycosyltransferase family 4 protein [Thermoguttaceae bacterium]|nr:glycosyltransferase family 4 protein [Thermoguttaceae bacterium]
MRVWMAGAPGVWVSPGGGEVQLTATAQALREQGLEVHLLSTPSEATRWADVQRPNVLHLFGSHPTHWQWIRLARQVGAAVVLSPIGWFSLASYWQGGKHWPTKLLHSGKFLLRAVCPWLPSWRGRLYRSVDMLLPNSLAEARQLNRYFGAPPGRIHVVPNGADPRFAQARAELFVQKTGLQGFVFCPGRLEPRKNQLGLLRAMRGCRAPIVLMGDPVPGQEAYAEMCRREAGPNVHFLPRLPYDDPLLASAYAACGCLALASWFETPGLAALEAAMQGASLVLPDVLSCREYFGDWALYVRPYDLRAIRRAVEKALQMGRNPRLAQHVLGHYTWAHTAEATRGAYARAMDFCLFHPGDDRLGEKQIPAGTCRQEEEPIYQIAEATPASPGWPFPKEPLHHP